MSDLISREAVLKHIEKIRQGAQMMDDIRRASIIMNGMDLCEEAVRNQPSAQSDRDIPIKPAEATETYCGRCVRAAVCPKCDYHLGRVYFLSDGHDIGVRKISYCETCGQAIDWSEWEDEE